MKTTIELSYEDLKVAITKFAQSRMLKSTGAYRIQIKKRDVGMNMDPEYIAILEEEDNGVTPVGPVYSIKENKNAVKSQGTDGKRNRLVGFPAAENTQSL